MKKIAVSVGCFLIIIICLQAELQAELFVPVNQKDWAVYFPDIDVHPSEYEPEFETVDMSYETPHTAWAKPYYSGKIKTLIVAPRVCMHDVVELAQRLDMEFDTLCAFSRKNLGGSQGGRYDMPIGFSEAERYAKLNEKLSKPIDVLIVGKMAVDALPRDIQERVKEMVKNGMGLVIVCDGTPETYIPQWILEIPDKPGVGVIIGKGVPFTAVDRWKTFKSNEEAAEKLVAGKELGKGRIAVMRLSGVSANAIFVPSPSVKQEINLWQVDYYFSLAVRAVVWAAEKEPKGDVGCVVANNKLRVSVDGLDNMWDELEIKIRDNWGQVVFSQKGKQRGVELTDLGAGDYIADATVLMGGKSLNWCSTGFSIKKAPMIKALEAEPKAVKPGDEVKFKVVLSEKCPSKGRLDVVIEDMYGRLIEKIRKEINANQISVDIPFKVANPVCNLLRVRAELTMNRKLQSHAEAWLPVKYPYANDDFGFVCWNLCNPDYLWYYARKELVKLGVDTSYGGKDMMQSWVSATAGIHTIPYMTRYAINKTTPAPYYERVPCLSDPVYIQEEQKNLKMIAEEMSPFGAAAYSLGDENDLSVNDHEVCFSKSCKAAFREYLKGVYGTLEALNQEWGCTNASWEEIEPMPLWEAQQKNQPARWVDFRMSMENVFVNIHQAGITTVKSVDPEGLVGFDGGFNTSSYTGYDWWKLSRVLELWGIYPDHLQTEILRSFHRPDARTGRWCGGYYNIMRYEEFARWEPWYELLHEMNNIWWFNIIHSDADGPQAEDTLNPASFKPFPILRAASEETLAIKAGIGKLLLGCRRDSDGIAILYSQPSLHAATYHLIAHTPNDSQLEFIKILEDIGYSYRFVSYEQLKDGMLNKEKYRLIILPCAIALSPVERDRLYEFAANGGKVIADTMPGIYDSHGKPVDDKRWEGFVKDHVLSIGSMIYNYRRDAHYAPAMREYMGNQLRGLKIVPEVTVLPDKGTFYEGELARFIDGTIQYIGLIRDHAPSISDQKARINLPGKSHVYDIRIGHYLGEMDQFDVALELGRTGLWALLPEKISELKLTVKPDAVPGDYVSYQVELKTKERHVIRVEVTDPQGNLVRHYCNNITLNQDRAEGGIPLALNDLKGIWTLSARDVASGVSVTQKLMVK